MVRQYGRAVSGPGNKKSVMSGLRNFSSVIIGTWPFWAKSWPGRSREVMGGYGRLREVTEEENGGNGGKWRNSEAQRRAASVGVRNKIVCKGMRSYTEEGGGEGVQSKEKSSKGAADGLGFCSYGIVRGCLG